MRHRQIGGVQTASINPDEMVAHALRFASEVREGKSEAASALVVPYTALDFPEQPNFVDILAAEETLEFLMTKRRDTFERLKAFDFIVTHIPSNSTYGRKWILTRSLVVLRSLCEAEIRRLATASTIPKIRGRGFEKCSRSRHSARSAARAAGRSTAPTAGRCRCTGFRILPEHGTDAMLWPRAAVWWSLPVHRRARAALEIGTRQSTNGDRSL